jgi:phosphocarrier protein HPr
MEIERAFTVINSLGIHARAAARIVELGKLFNSRLYLRREGMEVEGDGILSILSLACTRGTTIHARIEGKDAKTFMEALEKLIADKFGEKS